jgi:hypothetical protein
MHSMRCAIEGGVVGFYYGFHKQGMSDADLPRVSGKSADRLAALQAC